jgi:hypothetical protein
MSMDDDDCLVPVGRVSAWARKLRIFLIMEPRHTLTEREAKSFSKCKEGLYNAGYELPVNVAEADALIDFIRIR